MATVEEAKNIIATLNNAVMYGLRNPVTIKFAGDGVPLVQKVTKMLESGEKMYTGTIKSFSAEKKNGYIGCEEVMKTLGVDVYSHHSVMERGMAGPGDTVVFFMHWKGTSPQAALPMMRIGAECSADEKRYALKGWYKGIADIEGGFGFIECTETKILFGKDVYVHKELAAVASPGFVCFNCRLQADSKDGQETFLPMASSMQNCDENWKTTPGDLAVSREAESPITGMLDPWKALNNVMSKFMGDTWMTASPEGGGIGNLEEACWSAPMMSSGSSSGKGSKGKGCKGGGDFGKGGCKGGGCKGGCKGGFDGGKKGGCKGGKGGVDGGFKHGDWVCPSCGDHVFASKSACKMCGSPRPDEGGGSWAGGGGGSEWGSSAWGGCGDSWGGGGGCSGDWGGGGCTGSDWGGKGGKGGKGWAGGKCKGGNGSGPYY